MPADLTGERRVREACHTALSELGDECPIADLSDTVYGLVGGELYDEHESLVLKLLGGGS